MSNAVPRRHIKNLEEAYKHNNLNSTFQFKCIPLSSSFSHYSLSLLNWITPATTKFTIKFQIEEVKREIQRTEKVPVCKEHSQAEASNPKQETGVSKSMGSELQFSPTFHKDPIQLS